MCRALLHNCAQQPRSARAADAVAAAAQDDEGICGPTPCPSPIATVTTADSPSSAADPTASGYAGDETNTHPQTDSEKLLQQAIDAKQKLEARIEELRAATAVAS